MQEPPDDDDSDSDVNLESDDEDLDTTEYCCLCSATLPDYFNMEQHFKHCFRSLITVLELLIFIGWLAVTQV